MKTLFTGDISFDWIPPAGPLNMIPHLFRHTLFNPELEKLIKKENNLTGLKGWLEMARMDHRAEIISAGLRSLFQSYDFVCANLECALTSRGKPLEGKKYTLRGSAYYLSILKQLNISSVCLANNHILDYGLDGLEDTLKYLKLSGINYCGIQHNNKKQSPMIIGDGENKIAILNYVEPRIIDPDPKIYFDFDIHPYALNVEQVVEDIASAAKNYPVVVVPHWGEEWSFLESESQTKMAHLFIDNGASAVIGHHPHLAGRVEEYKNGIIAYSLGNLFMMLPPFSAQRAKRRFAIELNFDKKYLSAYNLITLSDDSSGLPIFDDKLNINSLAMAYIPSIIKDKSIVFDSNEAIKRAEVSSSACGQSAIWSDDFSNNNIIIQGKLPTGPGWYFREDSWCGVTCSRELMGDSYLSVMASFMSGDDKIGCTFKNDFPISKIYLAVGCPSSFQLTENFGCPKLELYNGDSIIFTFDASDRTADWTFKEITLNQPESSLRVVTKGIDTEHGYLCWRIWGV